MLTTREPAVLVLEDGRTFTGRAYGAAAARSARPSSPPA
jgi:carbamoyl-phosphate synthase small subunit